MRYKVDGIHVTRRWGPPISTGATVATALSTSRINDLSQQASCVKTQDDDRALREYERRLNRLHATEVQYVSGMYYVCVGCLTGRRSSVTDLTLYMSS